ncbi:MAG: RsmE family RNA methyltransferase, partial [Streptococcus salivarius]|nr:RsmE family RNA methyltransferase [Streptococcus salivarius]
SGRKIVLIIGPEGGFSPTDIDAFEKAGGLKICFGPCIMRTETAPLYALSSVSYALELNK